LLSFQIKEGAENLRKVAKDKKSVSDVNHIVKKSNTKLSELQAELQELDSQLLVTQGNLSNSPLTGTSPLPPHPSPSCWSHRATSPTLTGFFKLFYFSKTG
jgi:hypothetical protein